MNKYPSKMPIEKGLSSKIYLVAYDEPKSGYQIANRIYGHDHHRVRKVLNEFSKEGYFKKVEKNDWIYPKWQSNIDSIIQKIEQDIIVSDEYILRNILNSEAFKFLLNKQLPEDLRNATINSIDFIISLIDILIIISEGNKIFNKYSKRIKVEKDYRNAIDQIQENTNFKEKTEQIIGTLFKHENKRIDYLPTDVLAELPILFIFTNRLKAVTKGFSEFGKKYYEIKPISDKISKLLEA